MNNVEGSLQVAESIPVRQEVLKLAEESGLEVVMGNDILELIGDRKEKETEELANLTPEEFANLAPEYPKRRGEQR